jgi:teichuronic acid biosynthesis glycosyltransferase TuaG
MPLVSIIMPSYNSSAYIAASIDSVVRQTFLDWELLICDDSSDDESLDIAVRFSYADSRIKVFKNKNKKGAAGARNTCLSKASGRYIAFLDSDDLWNEKKLEIQIKFMQDNLFSFTFTYYEVIDEQNIYQKSYKGPRKVNLKIMRFANFVPCLTAVYDSKILGKVSQPEIKKRNDFALWLKILSLDKDLYAYCLPVVTAKYRENNYGLSSRKFSTLFFFRHCLVEYGNVSRLSSHTYSMLYILIYLIKSKWVSVYNFLITRI